jgi:hypothetical protein
MTPYPFMLTILLTMIAMIVNARPSRRQPCRMCGPNWSAPLCESCRAIVAGWVWEWRQTHLSKEQP